VAGDPVPVSIPAGARYFTRSAVRAEAPPYLVPFSRWSSPQCGDWVNERSDPSVISEGLPGKGGQPSKAFGPLNILGKTPAPPVAVAILGDSVVAGEPGAGDRLGDLGYVERALAANVAWCNLAVGGDGLERFLRFHPTRLGVIRDNFTHAICALGIQDIREGNETAIRAHFLQVWHMLADLGLKVFQATITTHTSSIDRWTTIEGQTIVNPNFLPGGIYHRINDWIRSVPAPLAGYFAPARCSRPSRIRASGLPRTRSRLPPTGRTSARSAPRSRPARSISQSSGFSAGQTVRGSNCLLETAAGIPASDCHSL